MEYRFQRRDKKRLSKQSKMEKHGAGLRDQYPNAIRKRVNEIDRKKIRGLKEL